MGVAPAVMLNSTALLIELRSRVDALESSGVLDNANANTWWLLSNGILVFFMRERMLEPSRSQPALPPRAAATAASACETRLFSRPSAPARTAVRAECGFGMLEAGSVTAKSTQNILLKNLLDTSISAVVWWAIGHGIAYDGTNPFIGTASGKTALFFAMKMNNEDADGWMSAGSASGYDWAFFFFQFTFAAAAATIVSGAVAERTRLLAYLLYSTLITTLIFPVVVHWVWSPHGFLSYNSPDR